MAKILCDNTLARIVCDNTLSSRVCDQTMAKIICEYTMARVVCEEQHGQEVFDYFNKAVADNSQHSLDHGQIQGIPISDNTIVERSLTL